MRDDCTAVLAIALIAIGGTLHAQPVGSAFTYQGQLTESGQSANGIYDLQVCLFDTPSNPIPLACAPDFDDVPVEAGVFTLALDFGSAAFAGQQRFLELRVRPGASSGSLVILAPRQPVRPTPEALRAGVASAAPWSGLTEVPPGFADGIDNAGTGTVTAITAGTGLSGGTITTSGTIAIANGGVGAAQIAPGAVGAVQLAAGAVGIAQIDTNQVQARISGSCGIGEYFRGIHPDGSLACEPVPGAPRITIVDDPANYVGAAASVANGADGLPVISYYDGSFGTLQVAKCADAACSGPATITTVDASGGQIGFDNGIAVGTDGNPVIAYLDLFLGRLKVAKCANPACTGSATVTVVDDPVNEVGWHASIAIGADGLPVIAYQDTTAGTLKVAKCANAACTGTATITVVDGPAGYVGWDSSIAIGLDGLPVISYGQAAVGFFRVARCANAACTAASVSTLVDPSSSGLGTSIAIGTDGRPLVSYRISSTALVRVARCANIACSATSSITTVDDLADTSLGFDTSIAIGSDGVPVVAYNDPVAGSVRVARCSNAECTGSATVTTIDDPANDVGVGNPRALLIGADNLPLIVYRDLTAGTLKVAKCGTRSCQ